MSTGHFTLAGELSIYRAAELKPLMLDAAAAGGDVSFDLSGVEEVDTAGLQLLLLAQREAASRGHALHIAFASPCVREALMLLGLDEQLLAQPGS